MPGKIFFYVRNSKITNPKVLNSLFDPEGRGHISLKDGKYTCEVLEEGKRSLPQNSYFHAILPAIKVALWEHGWKDTIKNEDDVKRFLKGKFLRREMVNHETGETIYYIKDTRDLTVTEFRDFIEDIIKFAAEDLYLVLKKPGEQGEFGYFD